jgi:hypothetical protein
MEDDDILLSRKSIFVGLFKEHDYILFGLLDVSVVLLTLI